MFRLTHSPRALDFIHFWKPFVRFFQLFCISHYGILRAELKDQRVKLALHRIFFIVNVSFQLFSAYSYCELKMKMRLWAMEKYDNSPMFKHVYFGTRFIEIGSLLVISCETFFNRRSEKKLFETLECIDGMFGKLHHSIDYGMHRHQQMKKAVVYLIGMISFIITTLSVDILIVKPDTYFGAFVPFCIFVVSRLRVFQVSFLINVLCDLLGELKVVMLRQQNRVKYNPAHWKDIQNARKIYSKIWLLKTLIGDCFGYSMVLFVIDSAVKLTNCVYWIYLNFESLKSTTLHARERIYLLISNNREFIFQILYRRMFVHQHTDSADSGIHLLDIKQMPKSGN